MLLVVVVLLLVGLAVVRHRRPEADGWSRRRIVGGGALVALGVLLHLALLATNDGHVPATRDARRTAGQATIGAAGDPVAPLSERALWPLGHVLAWPDPLPLATTFGLTELLGVTGVAVALRPRRRLAPPQVPVTRMELTSGQIWWEAAPGRAEALEVVLPGGVLRASDARLGVETGPRGGVVIVVAGAARVEGPGGTVEVVAGHGLALTPEGPASDPQPLTPADLAGDPWIAAHLEGRDERPAAGPSEEVEPPPWRPTAAATVGVAALGVAVLATYVAQVAIVPSGSMEPTLRPGDRVLVAKAAGAPAPGDVVVFEQGAPGAGEPLLLVKRVVAVGGQTVVVRDGWVEVDGRRRPDRHARGRTEEVCGPRGPVVVPAGALYVLGDDREDSTDSRCFGPVPGARVVGSVTARVWPPGTGP